MNVGIVAQNRSPLTFFVRVFALSTPFFWIGSVTELQPMPRFCSANLASPRVAFASPQPYCARQASMPDEAQIAQTSARQCW